MADVGNSKIARLVKWLTRVPGGHSFGVTTGPNTTRYDGSLFDVPASLICHENKHKEQYRKHGRLKFWILYLWYQMVEGYEGNPFEVEAREAESGCIK